MTLQEIIDMSRYRLNNYELPRLWYDSELVLYANETVNTICREAKCLEDSMTASCCQFFTKAGTIDYALHSSIIYIKSAKLRTQETITLDVAPAATWSAGDTLTGATSLKTCIVVAKLTDYTYTVKNRSGQFTLGEVISNGTYTADQGATYPTFTDTTTNTTLLVKQTKREMDEYFASWRAQPQTQPLRYILDYQAGYISLYANPDNYYPIDLTIIRYPLTQLTTNTMSSQTPEIPLVYHNTIIEGICAQAYQKRGDDTYDINKSASHYANFRKMILDMKIQNNLHESEPGTASPHKGFI